MKAARPWSIGMFAASGGYKGCCGATASGTPVKFVRGSDPSEFFGGGANLD
jgi:hypothetical protein